jgi:RNA polymerase sigma-70 factor (ECF subfamily)
VDDLLGRCLDGDAEARDLFVDRHAAVVFATARRVLMAGGGAGAPRDPAVEAEDVVQETFLRLFRDGARLLRTYDPSRASVATWLAVIARSTTLDILRKKRPSTVPAESAERVPAPEPKPPTQTPTSRVTSNLHSPRQRLVMQLIYDRGLSVAEVARLLGVAAQTVRSARHKALAKLRDFFGVSRRRGQAAEDGDASPRPRVEHDGGRGR